ncbi:MAG: membrane protein insertion efficiency factor YidD [Acidobacteriia bacterium]|nr:membrane protein insertion efficiency factor YidD [Terriglobia bacterium]MBZ5629268.1 membrane protein insertion efficiency factor YidD [Terriglobia bacterium]
MKPALLLIIRLYQRLVSPLLPPACRYVPTCSEYAAEALEIHGPWQGAVRAAWRLLRCHPFSRGGYDPVPHTHAEPAVKRHEVASGLTPGA